MDRDRTQLDDATATEIERRVFSTPGFHRLTLVRRQGGGTNRESLRPLVLRGQSLWQHETFVKGRTLVRNYEMDAAAQVLGAMLAAGGPREYHLQTTAGDLHVRVTRKGRQLVSRGSPTNLDPDAKPAERHDRVKPQPLDRFDSGALLRVLGIADGEGRPRASMRPKLAQVNAFLREVQTVIPEDHVDRPLHLVDCGCGRAYLTLAAYCYLTMSRGRVVQVTGIDRNAALIEQANAMAAAMDIHHDVFFQVADLSSCQIDPRPDLLLALHACDTATDEALARGVDWGARAMLVAPCCQHAFKPRHSGAMRALLRDGILRERLADLLTDSFRAQLLRILGYRVRVVEFVAPDVTPRNLLLRAVSGLRPGQAATVADYLALRHEWGETPHLEKILGERLRPMLDLATDTLDNPLDSLQ